MQRRACDGKRHGLRPGAPCLTRAEQDAHRAEEEYAEEHARADGEAHDEPEVGQDEDGAERRGGHGGEQ